MPHGPRKSPTNSNLVKYFILGLRILAFCRRQNTIVPRLRNGLTSYVREQLASEKYAKHNKQLDYKYEACGLTLQSNRPPICSASSAAYS